MCMYSTHSFNSVLTNQNGSKATTNNLHFNENVNPKPVDLESVLPKSFIFNEQAGAR